MTTWPDTTGQDEPRNGSPWWWAAWLLGRHPVLAQLAGCVPGLVVDDPRDATTPDMDLNELANAFTEIDDDTLERVAGRMAVAILPMSRGEVARLRLLATFATDARVPINAEDLAPLDENGRRLLADWCRAVQAL